MDPQGNTSRGLGLDTSADFLNIFDVIYNKKNINLAIYETPMNNLEIIPSKLVVKKDSKYEGDYTLLKNAINQIKLDYDFLIIDCPPSTGFLTLNCLVAASSVLIPIQCEYFALNGITQILATINKVQTLYNEELAIEGVVLTMFDSKNELDEQIALEIQNVFRENIYGTRIPRSNSIPESNMKGLPVIMHRPTSSASTAYLSLAKEILK
jgi:chromosome partitioning protein